MPAFLVQLADAIVASLAAATFGQAVDAARQYLPSRDLKDLKTLRATVVPRGVEIAPVSRALDQFEYSVHVAIQKKLDADGLAEIDGLMLLVEEICDHFRATRILGLACSKVENAPVYADDHLGEMRAFTSLITLTYRKAR